MNSNFNSLSLSPELKQTLLELDRVEMTPVQSQCIPLILSGKDIIAQSKTGSGKTLAFCLPILHKINLKNRCVQALILCPTRELCFQIVGVMRKLGKRHLGLQVLSLAGGQVLLPQTQALEQGAQIVVGTPGRVLDHLNRNHFKSAQLEWIVLDEADRMLEMGFRQEMDAIFKKIVSQPSLLQVLFFSATYPKEIELLSRSYQRQPQRVTIEEKDSDPIQGRIAQFFYEVVSEDEKFKGFLWIYQQIQCDSAVLFCNFKSTVVTVTQALERMGLSVAALHGDMEQRERDRVMAQFRNKSLRLLVATDVAARGMDIENLDCVFHYELSQAQSYVHRMGRTGRAGRQGMSVALIYPKERNKILRIQAATGQEVKEKQLARVGNLNLEDFKKKFHPPALTTLRISLGRKDKLRPGDILGALTGEGISLTEGEVGKIEIHDHFSYVAVVKERDQWICNQLKEGRVKGRRCRVELIRS